MDPVALEDRRARATAHAVAVTELARLAGLASDLAARKTEHATRAATARVRRAKAKDVLVEVEARRGLLDQRLGEARQALDLSEAAADKAAAACVTCWWRGSRARFVVRWSTRCTMRTRSWTSWSAHSESGWSACNPRCRPLMIR